VENRNINHRHRGEEEREDRFAGLRQVLNVVFMLGAIVGVLLYMGYNQQTGIIVILAAMVLKFIECVLRLIK